MQPLKPRQTEDDLRRAAGSPRKNALHGRFVRPFEAPRHLSATFLPVYRRS